MKIELKCAAILLVAMMAASFIMPIAESNESSGAVTITDSTGKTITLDEPAGKVATLGYGFTISVIDLGFKDKIVAYDNSSTYASSNNEKVKDMDVINVGSAFSSNKDAIVAKMIQAVNDSIFDKNKDVIILNNYSGTISPGSTRDMLEGEGFKVACYGGSSYDDVLFIVRSISDIVGGDKDNVIGHMEEVKTTVSDKTKDIADLDKRGAMYVAVYSGNITISNTGIAASMIEMAGGKNLGNNGASTSTHVESASYILQANPHVVFLDGNYAGSAEDFQNDVLKTTAVKVVKLEKDWNNFCPSVTYGLEAVYAELYGTGSQTGASPFETNMMVIAAAGIGTVVLAGVIIFLVRRR